MRHYFLVVTLSLASWLLALPVGNPADPKLLTQGTFQKDSQIEDYLLFAGFLNMSFRVGYYQDVVKNRNMAQLDFNSNKNQNTLESNIHTYAAYLVANFFNRLDVFATLGSTNYQYASSFSDLKQIGYNVNLSQFDNGISWVVSNNEFSWSVGGRLIIFEYHCLTIGLEGQCLQACPKIQYVDLGDAGGLNNQIQLFMGSSGMTTRYTERQIGLGASYQIKWIVPYMAIKLSGMKLKTGTPIWQVLSTNATSVITLKNLEQSKTLGFAVGVSLVNYNMGSIAIEARFADEVGYYLNGQLRF